MFPSTNCNNPFDESFLTITRPSPSPPSPFTSSSHQNLTPKHDDNDNDLLFNFPSPFLDEQESPLNQIFLRPIDPKNLVKSKIEDQIPAAAAAPPPRRHAGKKDRHSKICTAQGVRDRRMRLSLQAARKFFDLQDILGYDKASKTIEWLFAQSSEAIKELAHAKRESFLSECEDLSGIEEISSSAVAPDAKALREKARARRRTQEKMVDKRLRFSGDCFTPNPSIPINEIRVSEELGMIGKFWGNSSSDYQCAASDPGLVGFLGNWDVLSSERFHFSVGNQVSFAGNLGSVFSEFH
ncbi:hypothetical protein SASPL_130814 [Salvia splendens]|uniref:TCP domain-containing protein n=1 Tax=Salvia splendens TaxID=180675 RepID=A0A4D8YC69_SALSN|nr:transcription factor TCP12-like [Salvia splendens]XP_042006170.1 transcription factor TCP12-like [Salvia splendens]KAG6407813.1 hypothetical protein SASPL_130812 [Salvia splendens]KAG6407815.1 hypothetical protein SASPL_130814 [Salvia splendens]